MDATTPLGFNVQAALQTIIKPEELHRFDEWCRVLSSGCHDYDDPRYGKQSIQYIFQRGVLIIEFTTAELLCYCPDVVVCDCDDTAEMDFDGWGEYWAETHEKVVLNKLQLSDYLNNQQYKMF